MFDDFDNLTKIALWEETLGESPKGYRLVKFKDHSDISEFFKINYEAWKNEKQKPGNQVN